MKKLRNIAILFLSFFSIGCGDSPNSYNKNWGKWSFQSYSPMNGIRATTEMDVDNKTFEVLSNRNFAKDKNHVYYRGNIIEGADGASLELAENDYSIKYGRDKNHLYFNREKIENADPTTFSRVQKSDDDGRII
ncbi:MAG: DKNYY domain-containing protein, partial [Saprospiraceae bacterium]